ncbi:MAG: formimidoylglutamase [Francisellaceae bacterium]
MYKINNKPSSYCHRQNPLEDKQYFYELIQNIDLDGDECIDDKRRCYVMLGFAVDEGVKRNQGRIGAKAGPQSFRDCFYNLPIQRDNFTLFDAGNIECINGDLETAQKMLGHYVAKILNMGAIPLIIGGGHELAWGDLQGFYACKKNPVIVNFDAHLDLRETLPGDLGSSGTPFYQASQHQKSQNKLFDYHVIGVQPYANSRALFDYATAHQVKLHFAEDIRHNPNDFRFIDNISDKAELYVTVCMDAFSSAQAPGVSAPQVLGIDAQYVIDAIKKLKQTRVITALSIAELNPKYDINNCTAKLAAIIMAAFIH